VEKQELRNAVRYMLPGIKIDRIFLVMLLRFDKISLMFLFEIFKQMALPTSFATISKKKDNSQPH